MKKLYTFADIWVQSPHRADEDARPVLAAYTRESLGSPCKEEWHQWGRGQEGGPPIRPVWRAV